MAKKIRIGLSLISGVSYGGITYFQNLIPALRGVDRRNEYHIFVKRGHQFLKKYARENFIFHESMLNDGSMLQRILWEQWVLPGELKKYNIDLVFTAKNAAILCAPCRNVICIRNLEPLCYARYKNHWALDIFSFLRSLLTRVSMRRADAVVAVSRNTQQYLEQHFPYVRGKVTVVYNGNPRYFSSVSGIHQERQFILSASKFVAYANQYNLIRGYAQLIKKGHDVLPLVFAGGILDKKYYRKIKRYIAENGLEGRITFLGLIPRTSLLALYRQASAFLFPSTLESCPQTLIEAMGAALPIAAADVAPMPEICTDAAVYFDPYNIDDIADKINVVLNNKEVRRVLQENARKRVSFFDWENTASALVKIFEATADSFKKDT